MRSAKVKVVVMEEIVEQREGDGYDRNSKRERERGNVPRARW